MMRLTIFRGFLLLALTGFSNLASAQNLDEILAKHIEAMGGSDKLSKLKSVKITAEMSAMSMKVPISTTIVQNQGFRSETTIQGTKVIQAINGNTGWAINPMARQDKPTALPEEAVKGMAAETDITGLYNYKEKGYTLALDGEEDLAGAKVYKVSMALKNGVKRVNYISKDTFYILKIVATTNIDGQEMLSENVQSDFRKVDGITYPFASNVTTSAMPGATMNLRITSLEINPKIDQKIFAMPQ